jgi:hypothetical protein
MPERDKNIKRPSPSKSVPRRGDEPSVSRERKIGGSRDVDSEESTPSRPHGTTEDPDRTL